MNAKVSTTWDVPSYYHVLAQETWLCSEERGTAEGVSKRQRGEGWGSLCPSDSLSIPLMNKAPWGSSPPPRRQVPWKTEPRVWASWARGGPAASGIVSRISASPPWPPGPHLFPSPPSMLYSSCEDSVQGVMFGAKGVWPVGVGAMGREADRGDLGRDPECSLTPNDSQTRMAPHAWSRLSQEEVRGGHRALS